MHELNDADPLGRNEAAITKKQSLRCLRNIQIKGKATLSKVLAAQKMIPNGIKVSHFALRGAI